MIMAGGAGTRLWPLSRRDRPKQLLKFIRRPGSGEAVSLLELSVSRLDGLIPPERTFVCTGESYRGAISEAMPWLAEENVLGEPEGRDTVNAVGFAAAVLEKRDPEAVFCVLTADHVIEPVQEFQRLIDVGFRVVESDPTKLVTFSIQPTYAATGYGYVHRGQAIKGVAGAEGLAFLVQRFVEKPDAERAEAYVASGEYGWNSGMFVWKAATFLNYLKEHKRDNWEGLKEIQAAWGTERQQEVLRKVYPTLGKTSVDYAVMEPCSSEGHVATVLMDLRWLDVGSWPSYAETVEADADGNRTVGGEVIAEDSRGNLVVGREGRVYALLGCEGLVVVETEDVTLVMPRGRAEELKRLYARVPEQLK